MYRVLLSESDAGGYDRVMSHRKMVRHTQFATMMVPTGWIGRSTGR